MVVWAWALPARAEQPRVWSIGPTTWVWPAPKQGDLRLGFLRPGVSVALRSARIVKGSGCPTGYVPVEPRGFICLDRSVTRDSKHPRLKQLKARLPAPAALPFRYAISNHAPMYSRLPTQDEWQRVERPLGPAGRYPKYPWNEKHERLASDEAIGASDPLPEFLLPRADAGPPRGKLLRRMIPLGSMLSYTRAFEHDGRVWLLSSDGSIVPADRMRAFRNSAFEGVHLAGKDELPVAWPKAGAAKFGKTGGDYRELGAHWNAKQALFVQSTSVDAGGPYLEVTTPGSSESVWIRRRDVHLAQGAAAPSGLGADERWILVSVGQGTLVAYEGERAVFTTLISPGRGGISRAGVDPVQASTTPRGRFRIQYKYRAQTMSPDKDKPEDERSFWISEVPFTQYFSIPFALHTAYWHDDFGNWMSGGCVNLSPTDGQWLFGWTTPRLPEDWDGVWAGGDNGPGTTVVVVR